MEKRIPDVEAAGCSSQHKREDGKRKCELAQEKVSMLKRE